MGHDISGCNKAGEEIAYARFSMRNYNAAILYDVLNANDFNAGVSGSGHSSTYTPLQIEKALNAFKELNNDTNDSKIDHWDQKQILSFLQNCLTVAQKEGSVKVFFA